MSDFKNIKKRLSSSTTMPLGTGGGNEWLLQSIMAGHAGHVHKADGPCCSHHHEDDEDDTTNPKGGCC